MCPACISGLVWIAAGTGSAGGLTAWAVKVLRGKRREEAKEENEPADRRPVPRLPKRGE